MSEAGQFQPGFNPHGGHSAQHSARPDSNSMAQQLNSGRHNLHEEYSEEAYLEYQNIDEVDDEQNITQNEGQIGNFVQ